VTCLLDIPRSLPGLFMCNPMQLLLPACRQPSNGIIWAVVLLTGTTATNLSGRQTPPISPSKYDPLGTPVADILFPNPSKTQPSAPALNNTVVVGSPPSAPDASPTDPKEMAMEYAATIADKVHKWTAGGSSRNNLGSVTRIEGGSCEEVCTRCIMASQGMDTGAGLCGCFANCIEGVLRNKCKKHSTPGWSNDQQTVPSRKWKIQCGYGDRDCASCVSQSFSNQVAQCKNSSAPSTCMQDLRKQFSNPWSSGIGKQRLQVKDLSKIPNIAMRRLFTPRRWNAASDPVFCKRDRMSQCDVFAVTPTNSSRDWSCFPTLQACQDAVNVIFGVREGRGSRDPVSIWNNVN